MIVELNRDNYFSKEADMEYLSVSQYKNFLECESKALALCNGEWKYGDKTAFLLGSYFHAWCEGVLEKFIEENSSKIMMKSKKDKLASFKEVDTIISTLENNPVQYKLILDIIRNPNNKKEQIFTGKLFGANWKIMIDIYNPNNGYFSDLKLVKSLYDRFYNVSSGKYENFILHYNYHLQMFIYSQIEKIANNRDNILRPILTVVTKENPINTALFINFEDVGTSEDFLGILQLNVERILSLKKGESEPFSCEKCDYCRSKQKTNVYKYNFSI